MRGVSTFGAFTTARLGIYAAQKALDVTGHNITNINTTGYTRQRLDQMSLRVGGSDRYASSYDARIGSGVLCTGVSQLRDPYLDIRYRNELSSVGSMDAKLDGLNELSGVLDEIRKSDGSGVVEKQFNDFMTQLQNLGVNAGKNEFDTLVRNSAESLAKLLQSYSTKLGTIKNNQTLSFSEDLKTVNNLLKNIGSLNDKIFKSELHGDGALEMKDQRNLMLDELSGYMKINIKYEPVSVGAGATVDKMIITLGGSPGTGDGNDAKLVDGAYATQFGIRQLPTLNPDYDATAMPPGDRYLKVGGGTTDDETEAILYDSPNFDLDLKSLTDDNNQVLVGSTPTKLGDQALFGSLQAAREMLTKAGEFSTATDIQSDPNATTKRGIPYYEKSLNALASRFAEVMNGLNPKVNVMDKDGNYLNAKGEILTYTDVDGTTKNITKDIMNDTTIPPALQTTIKETVNRDGATIGGPLFSTSSDNDNTDGITAANISISKGWSSGNVRIVGSYTASGTNNNDNIREMIIQMDGKHDFKPSHGTADPKNDNPFFQGSFQEMLTNMCGTLASDTKTTNTLLNNYASSATEIDINRSVVSGVDLNDEAANMMQYQKSYSAACRLMTTLDEALDKLINGTGVVGR